MALMVSIKCYSADVVLIRSTEGLSPEQQELEIAARFYGLDLRIIDANDAHYDRAINRINDGETLGVAIEADALQNIHKAALLQSLHRGRDIPLFIMGFTPSTDKSLLRSWSGGAVVGIQQLADERRLRYVVGHATKMTRQLAGIEMPFPGKSTYYFTALEASKIEEVISVGSDRQTVPVFIQTKLGGQEVFLLPRLFRADDKGDEKVDGTVNAFARLAPLMMFVKYCSGEYGFHAINHYANLTIDDPWLREPYGQLSYSGLLSEMQRHHFHTTIAFIPWNYDRNEFGTVTLFRNHPDQFSISIHGNNHDHEEFIEPNFEQVADLKQALARMERFKVLTGIPYDKVMIFPHSIGSENILEELKTYNFLATVNSSNTPMNLPRATDLWSELRPVTLTYGNFPSIARHPVTTEPSNELIAINDFLDNPLLFYSHQSMFTTGSGAFNDTADAVNKIEPETRWRSLGEIVKHLYLVRLRSDSSYDVVTFSSTFELQNTFGHDVVFHFRKEESAPGAIASVTVDGQQLPFQIEAGNLESDIFVPSGGSRTVQVLYKNDLELASVSTSKDSIRVYVLRMASDFRDIALSNLSAGRVLTEFYYKHQLSPRRVILWAAVLTIFCASGIWILRFATRKNSAGLRAQLNSEPLKANAAGRQN